MAAPRPRAQRARRGEIDHGALFVYRPIVAIVLSIILVLLGAVAMLPIAQPEIVLLMVQVTTTFIGASATDDRSLRRRRSSRRSTASKKAST
jgi:hypothetical protein